MYSKEFDNNKEHLDVVPSSTMQFGFIIEIT